MILRHLTTKDKIQLIKRDGFLRGSDNLRKTHKDHVSFELFDTQQDRNAFIRAYATVRDIDIKEVVELFFDGDRMMEDGYTVMDRFISGKKDTKVELSIHPSISKDDYEAIGEYRFVYGRVPLEFLTEESKKLYG